MKRWFKAAGIRSLKTVGQTTIGLMSSSLLIHEVDWITVVSASALAGLLSILTSLTGLPELELEELE